MASKEMTEPWEAPEVADMPFPEGGIFVDVMGVGGDEGVRRAHYTPQGVTETQIPLRWTEASGYRCHDPDFIKEVAASGVMLAGPEGIYTGGLPGAGIFFADDNGKLVAPLLDYLVLEPHNDTMMEWLEECCGSLLTLYQGVEGANVQNAFFQPWCIAKFLLDAGLVVPNQVHFAATLADWWTMAAIERWPSREDLVGADRVMSKSQGISGEGGEEDELFEALGLDWLLQTFLMMPFFDDDTFLRAPNGCGVMPLSHDSFFARVMAFLVCEMMRVAQVQWGIWSGGWSGVMRLILPGEEVRPSEATFEANLAFEGSEGQMFAITNACLLGGFYKKLVEIGVASGQLRKEMAYRQAADAALRAMSSAQPPQTLALKGVSPAIEPKVLVGQRGYELALLDTIWTHAKLCSDQVEKGVRLLGDQQPSEIAFSGGWGLNQACLAAFRAEGLEPVTTPFVATTTHDGAAVLAYHRWLMSSGPYPSQVDAAKKIYQLRSQSG